MKPHELREPSFLAHHSFPASQLHRRLFQSFGKKEGGGWGNGVKVPHKTETKSLLTYLFDLNKYLREDIAITDKNTVVYYEVENKSRRRR